MAARRAAPAVEPARVKLPSGRPARLTLIGRGANGDLILRIDAKSTPEDGAALAAHFGLSPREADVLQWLARGKTNEDIAAILSISKGTVSKHIESILAKLAVENRTAAAIRAVKAGF